jgi:hypothetical protein
MKKLVFLCLTVFIAAMVAGQNPAWKFSYKHMKGTLGNQEAIFDLVIFNDDFNGNAIFPNLMIDKDIDMELIVGERLQGTLDKHGVADIEAYTGNLKTGEYSGLFGEAFKGTFRGQNNGRAQSFSLVEDYSESISFTGHYLYRDTLLLDTADAPHAQIELSVLLPEQSDSFPFIREAILDAFFSMDTLHNLPDDAILEFFCKNYLGKYINANIDIYDGGYAFNWEMQGTSYISMNRNGLLVYRSDSYAYAGGAHGMGISRFLVFDTGKKKQLSLKDIFVEGFEEELGLLLEKEYRSHYFLGEDESLTDAGLFDEQIFPSPNFFLTSNSIDFFYNPYELAPYSMGSISIKLYKSDIRQLLREDAAIMRLGW